MTEHLRTPKDKDKGKMSQIRAEAVDESAPIDEALGHKPFLQWEKKRDEYGRDFWEAVAQDGTVYTAVEDTPPPVEKDYIVNVKQPEVKTIRKDQKTE